MQLKNLTVSPHEMQRKKRKYLYIMLVHVSALSDLTSFMRRVVPFTEGVRRCSPLDFEATITDVEVINNSAFTFNMRDLSEVLDT